MDIHLLTPIEADAMVWTFLGLVSLILLTKKFGWASIASSLIVAEITMISVVVPLMMLRGWSPGAYRPTAWFIGFGGTYILGGLVSFLERLRDDPEGTIGRVLALWKGRNQGGER